MPTHSLCIKGLRFAYPGGPGIVDLPEYTLDQGEHALLRGGSGSGKSTLLSLIAGLLDPDSGEVRIAGESIHAVRGAGRDRYRGQHIGMVFQTFHLLPGFSAVENVMLGLMFTKVPKREHRDRAAELLKTLGVERPNAEPTELSVGQQQRVAVARAVVGSPSLVLADEPTASLDPENAKIAIELIRTSCQACGAALLCVSHDPAVWEHFERRDQLETLMGGA